MSGKPKRTVGHRWRYYETPIGRRPVREFLDRQADDDVAEILAEMAVVRSEGLTAARHVRGDIYEVRVSGANQQFRVLFASEGSKGRVLLALDAWPKTTRKTPPPKINLAQRRLASWRARGGKKTRRS